MSLQHYPGCLVTSCLPPLACLLTAELSWPQGLAWISVVLVRVTRLTGSSSYSRLPEYPGLLSILVRAACTPSASLQRHGVGPFWYVVWRRRKSSVSCGVSMARSPPRTVWGNAWLPVLAIFWTPVPVCLS